MRRGRKPGFRQIASCTATQIFRKASTLKRAEGLVTRRITGTAFHLSLSDGPPDGWVKPCAAAGAAFITMTRIAVRSLV